ncbi:solute carrier family 23 protein [Desulfonatronum parangueonense]
MSQKQGPFRPDGITYWVDERPPLGMTIMVALQQLAFLGSIMTLPVLLARQAGLDAAGAAGLVALTMVAAGCGVILQALNRGGIGIGLFSPMHTSAIAFPASLAAVKMGGLGLAFGMMTIAALVQIAASRLITQLRPLFPVEIAGLIVLMLGLGLGLIGMRAFLAIDTPFHGEPCALATGILTLAVIVTINVWGRGKIRAFAVFSGLLIGQMFAVWQGVVDASLIKDIRQVPLFALPPVGQFGWSFAWEMVPHFALLGLALSFNCFGVLTVAQRANDSSWKRPDMEGIKRGLLAEGMTNALCSMLNGMAQTASGGAVGLAQASGVTSRIVAYVLGGLFIALAFFPPFAAFWISLAMPVIGAVLMFVASFIIVGGIKIITSRLLDSRKIITIGLALIVGIGHDLLHMGHEGHQSLLFSPLSTTVAAALLVAIGLNALFRLNIHTTITKYIVLDATWQEKLNQLLWSLGHQWGARTEVVRRLNHAAHELLEAIYAYDLMDSGSEKPVVEFRAVFDEYLCQIGVVYTGRPLTIPRKRPDPEELLNGAEGGQAMAGFLVNHLADEVQVGHKNGKCTVTLKFRD